MVIYYVGHANGDYVRFIQKSYNNMKFNSKHIKMTKNMSYRLQATGLERGTLGMLRRHHTALYKGSKLLVRLPHQFDRKKMSMGLSSFELEFA